MPEANKTIGAAWRFASDSNPNRIYETLQYVDGSTSCNCKGWTQRITADGKRSCKHTRSIDMGIADKESVSREKYAAIKKAPNISNIPIRSSSTGKKRLIQI